MRKKVLITGAARGLGREIALEFAKDGYDILFTYHNSAKEASILKEIIERDYRVNVDYLKVDLRNTKDIDKLISMVNSIDILINNAAYNYDCDVFEKEPQVFEDILKVNLVAPFILAQKLYPLLKNSKGVIINITSTNGIDTMYPESLDYDASKAGLLNLTINLAKKFDKEVKVFALAPDWIDTDALSDMNPQFRKLEEERIGEFSKPQDVAKLVKSLVDKDFKTGTILRVNGGNYELSNFNR